MKKRLEQLFRKRVVVLDGACGTELYKRGMPAGRSPELWCLEHPEILTSVHKAYEEAGSDIIYTCTFGANRMKLGEYGERNVFRVNKALAELARKSVGHNTLVAGDIGPTGKFVKPFGELEFEEAVDIFKEQARGLLAGGADLVVIETMMDIQEARAALIAVKEVCDRFTLVTMTYEKEGRTLNGTDPLSALITLQSLGANAVGCNCSSGPKDMIRFIRAMKPYATVPLVAKPNAGIPTFSDGLPHFDMTPSEFGTWGRKLVSAGANFVGGCCGSNPDHIKSLRHSTRALSPRKPIRKNLPALSSARQSLLLDKRGFWIIGERINPTGKKKLQEELLAGRYGFVRTLAQEQETQGASLLDVNVGVPGTDEKETMLKVLPALSLSTDLPLVIDTSNPEVMEAALRFYPGRALINSISGETDKMKRLLPLARKYGPMAILLPMTGKKLPKNLAERKNAVRTLVRKMESGGLTKSQLIVDGLTMTISYDPEAALKTLQTLAWCSKTLKLKTVLGLSNISFGMPGRALINHAFLGLAKKAGLSFAIADPAVRNPLPTTAAQRLLLGKDPGGKKFLSLHTDSRLAEAQPEKQEQTPTESVRRAVLEGNREDIEEELRRAVATGIRPLALIENTMIPAIMEVGQLFDQKKYFLPQLIASAETMKKGFQFLKLHLKEDEQNRHFKGLILMATVQHDIHDIGKNIVSLMLSNHGFEVVDLGKDVSAGRIVSEIKRLKPDLVGLSALMTTTMVNMKEVTNMANQEGLSVRFMIGGAAVNHAYADSIGADYARDGVDAVRLAETLVSSKRKN